MAFLRHLTTLTLFLPQSPSVNLHPLSGFSLGEMQRRSTPQILSVEKIMSEIRESRLSITTTRGVVIERKIR